MKDGKVISTIRAEAFEGLKRDKVVSGGMIPKLQMGFKAIEKGVERVILKSAGSLNDENAGTKLTA